MGRCARLVTPSNRWLLENLRVIARVAAECRASANASRVALWRTPAGFLLMVILHRERLLLHIDTWVYPETTGRREGLAAAAGALALAGPVATVRRTVTGTVWNRWGSPATLLIAPDPKAEAHDFRTPDAKINLAVTGLDHRQRPVDGELFVASTSELSNEAASYAFGADEIIVSGE